MPSSLYAFSAGDLEVAVLLLGSHVLFTLPVILMVVLQYKSFSCLSRSRRDLSKMSWAFRTANWRQIERDRKLAVTSTMIIALFVIYFLPFYVKIHLMNFCDCTQSSPYRIYHSTSHNFLYFSSFLDPVMYAWRIPKFRRALKDCVRLRRRNTVVPRILV